ncbi:hypothetical protein L2E82_25771 [Cichorium intybus]|uniref:Uncharacterized protein n=1 Tax=Cichorium intybus TaxID=13427 RepID=A0ACB9E4W0_CICIN|nr:hypothetical protein L2E82_25771 [Cichorium intybus]
MFEIPTANFDSHIVRPAGVAPTVDASCSGFSPRNDVMHGNEKGVSLSSDIGIGPDLGHGSPGLDESSENVAADLGLASMSGDQTEGGPAPHMEVEKTMALGKDIGFQMEDSREVLRAVIEGECASKLNK